MTVVEQAEKILADYVDLRPPFDKKWKVAALEYVMKHLAEIAAFREMGLRLIEDHERRQLIADGVGEVGKNGTHEDIGFNVWLLNECIGERFVSPKSVWLRCLACHKIRTGRGVALGPCKCGSSRLSDAVGPMNTRSALGYLVTGY